MSLRFEWDPEKATRNIAKHRVSFPEAETVFADPLALDVPDPEYSLGEERFILVGRSFRQRLLVVAYTEMVDSVRIISAREATRHERRAYEEGA